MSNCLQWGVVGTGEIAADFAQALQHTDRGQLVHAVGSSQEKAQAFAQRFGFETGSGDLKGLLEDDAVQAVYIATPHTLHEAQAIQCMQAGKHVLCEKPMATGLASAERILDAAKTAGVFFMEAYMYRCHPLIDAVLERLKQNAIGKIRHVRADFSFFVPRQPGHRLFNPKLAGGGILDVGGYPLSMARLIAGVAAGLPFDEPTRLDVAGHIGETGVDELAVSQLVFASGMTAQLTCGVHCNVGTGVWIYGEDGVLHMPDPWLPGGQRQGLTATFDVTRFDGDTHTHTVNTHKPIYAIEAEKFADWAAQGQQAQWPAMGWGESQANMRWLEAWRKAVGVAEA